MAQTTNTLSSVDYRSMHRSTTISKDECDSDAEQVFLTPSLDIDASQLLLVGQSKPIMNENIDEIDSIVNDDSTPTPRISVPTNESYVNLSSSSSEASLARPLLPTNNRQTTAYATSINVNDVAIKPISSSLISNNVNHGSSIIFYLLDIFLSAFIITPLLNIHWRGAWDYLDLCLLPNQEHLSAVVSLALGLIILYGMYLMQNTIQSFYEKHREKPRGKIMARLYTLIIAFAYISQWRGLWNLLDFTSNHWIYLTFEILLSVTALIFSKSIYNLNSAPFLIGTDIDFSFVIESKHQISHNRFLQYTFDFIFYEMAEAPLVVVAWRGLYNLSDLYIFPENKTLSMIFSFAVGYILFFVLALTQIPFVRCFMQRQNHHIYSFLSNTLHLFAFISVVQIWRSLWMMCEQYLNINERPLLTLWLCYIIAYVILTGTFSACSLNGPGGTKDAFIDDQSMLVFQFDYTSDLMKTKWFLGKKKRKADPQISDASSTETIINAERPDQSESS